MKAATNQKGIAMEVKVNVIRKGYMDGVAAKVYPNAVKILDGVDGVNGTITMDYGEARELAEFLTEAMESFLSAEVRS